MPTIMFQVYATQSPCFGDKNQSSIVREQLKSPQFKQSLNRYSIGEKMAILPSIYLNYM